MYKTGETVHIQALCWGETASASMPISLRPHAGDGWRSPGTVARAAICSAAHDG